MSYATMKVRSAVILLMRETIMLMMVMAGVMNHGGDESDVHGDETY